LFNVSIQIRRWAVRSKDLTMYHSPEPKPELSPEPTEAISPEPKGDGISPEPKAGE
jgi:hypothetical protein